MKYGRLKDQDLKNLAGGDVKQDEHRTLEKLYSQETTRDIYISTLLDAFS